MKRWIGYAAVIAVLMSGVSTVRAATLQVGSTPTGVPFTFLNTKTNAIDGMMVDLIDAIGAAEGFTPEIQPMAFGSLVPALTSSKIDIIAAAMSATPVRQKVVDFTDPVYSYGEGLVVPASDTKEYHSIQDLKGYRVGAVIGTNYVDQAKALGILGEVIPYDSLADIIRDIGAGRLQAGLGDGPILAYNFAHTSMPAARLVKEYQPFVVGTISIAVRKDEAPLLDKMNADIARFKQDGTLAKILEKWNLH